jgi:hypothetical protein
VASNGVTSKQVCGFLTSVLVTQMLAGSHPDGAGTPQSYNGEAACTWADMAGNDFTVTVSANSGVIGCNGAAGTALHVSGWQGCYAPTAFVAYGSEGQDYVSVAYDFGGQAESLEPAQEAVITHVLQELHA